MKKALTIVAAAAMVWGLLGVGVSAQGDDGEAPSTTEGDATAADRCFGVHQFGQQPVDVAKSVDGSEVLAQVQWQYHDSIGCYLVLDDRSLWVLRASSQPLPLDIPATDQVYGDWQFSADDGDGIVSAFVNTPGGNYLGALDVICDSSFSELSANLRFTRNVVSGPEPTVVYRIRPAGLQGGTDWTRGVGRWANYYRVYPSDPVALAQQIAASGAEGATFSVSVDGVQFAGSTPPRTLRGTYSLDGAQTAVRHVLNACGHR